MEIFLNDYHVLKLVDCPLKGRYDFRYSI